MNEYLYQCQDLHFTYQLGRQQVNALAGINLEIERGKMVGFAGPSGSGKTTLLNLLGLIERPQRGQLYFNGSSLNKASERQRNRLRRFEMGHIFQRFNLLNTLNAYENVEYFLLRQGLRLSERQERVENALRQVGVWEQRSQRPLQMSGGQQQRVAIARALAKRPQVIIADEPTASLDQKTGKEIMGLLVELNQKNGMTVILSSHDSMVLAALPAVIPLADGMLNCGGPCHVD